jgi:DDE superfamily endonuclease
VIADGTIIPAAGARNRPAASRARSPASGIPARRGKAHTHGGNIQAVLAPGGFPPRVSPVEPGPVHHITATPAHALPALYRAAAQGPATLANPRVPPRGHRHPHPAPRSSGHGKPDTGTRTRNALHPSLPCPGERGFALLTGRWRALQHITLSPGKAGHTARAAPVLTHFEHGHIT